MATEIIIPKLGFSVDEATLAERLVKDGDEVKEGDPIFAVESDKSTQEIESPSSGVVKISAEAGETYPVGTVIGTIE